MRVLCIGTSEYINKNILKFNESNINYEIATQEDFVGINYFENLSRFNEYQVILVGIDYHVKDKFNFNKYTEILNNVTYLISKSLVMGKVIFLSTYGVYKEKKNNDFYNEDDEIEPQDYKSSIHYFYESILKNTCEKYQKQMIIVRMFNIFGLYQSEEFIITYLVSEMLNNNNDLFIGDMRKKRDYVYIKDFMSFINLVVSNKFEKKYNVYNFGMGKSHTIKEILEIIRQITRKDKNVVFNPNKIRVISDYNDVKADISKIEHELNFRFQYNIYEALSNFIELYKVNKGE